MCGHAKTFYPNWEPHWGVRAFERMGSLEQLALEDIGVTFDPQLHNKAMDARIQNTHIDRQTKHHGAKTVDTGVALRGRIGGAQLDRQANQLADAAAKQQRREQRRQRRTI